MFSNLSSITKRSQIRRKKCSQHKNFCSTTIKKIIERLYTTVRDVVKVYNDRDLVYSSHLTQRRKTPQQECIFSVSWRLIQIHLFIVVHQKTNLKNLKIDSKGINGAVLVNKGLVFRVWALMKRITSRVFWELCEKSEGPFSNDLCVKKFKMSVF